MSNTQHTGFIQGKYCDKMVIDHFIRADIIYKNLPQSNAGHWDIIQLNNGLCSRIIQQECVNDSEQRRRLI